MLFTIEAGEFLDLVKFHRRAKIDGIKVRLLSLQK